MAAPATHHVRRPLHTQNGLPLMPVLLHLRKCRVVLVSASVSGDRSRERRVAGRPPGASGHHGAEVCQALPHDQFSLLSGSTWLSAANWQTLELLNGVSV